MTRVKNWRQLNQRLMTKALSILIAMPFAPLITFCQNINAGPEVDRMRFIAKQVVPPSPEAAALGAYGNVPVSLYTGTPNISIPLYQIQGSSLSLPISLSYNASGFKPQDEVTW